MNLWQRHVEAGGKTIGEFLWAGGRRGESKMKLLGKFLAFLRRLFGAFIWFATAPKDWDPDLKDFEVKMKDGYLEQVEKREGNAEH
jgi:hypothetical protein